ncbi:hypothetical protein, partial [Clostridium botulinum]
MNRKQFDKMSVDAQLNYVNSKLDTGYTLTRICEEINIGRSTIRKRFKNKCYKFDKDLNRYVSYECVNGITSLNKKVDNTKTDGSYNNNMDITYDIERNSEVTKECACSIDNITLDKLYTNVDKILDMVVWWENRSIKNSID